MLGWRITKVALLPAEVIAIDLLQHLLDVLAAPVEMNHPPACLCACMGLHAVALGNGIDRIEVACAHNIPKSHNTANNAIKAAT